MKRATSMASVYAVSRSYGSPPAILLFPSPITLADRYLATIKVASTTLAQQNKLVLEHCTRIDLTPFHLFAKEINSAMSAEGQPRGTLLDWSVTISPNTSRRSFPTETIL